MTLKRRLAKLESQNSEVTECVRIIVHDDEAGRAMIAQCELDNPGKLIIARVIVSPKRDNLL